MLFRSASYARQPTTRRSARTPRSRAAPPQSRTACWRVRPARSEEHTSELQSHRDLHSFPPRCSSDLLLTHANRQHAAVHEHRGPGPLRRNLEQLAGAFVLQDRKSTRLNSSPTEISTLSLHDALPICFLRTPTDNTPQCTNTAVPGRSAAISNSLLARSSCTESRCIAGNRQMARRPSRS